MRPRFFIALFCAGALVAGCSGGTAIVPSATGTNANAAAAPDAHAGTKGRVRFRIKIPKRHRVQPHGMHAHYISQATQSIVVNITGPTTITNQASNLTPTSTGCSGSLADTVCLISFLLEPCPTATNCYTASLTTYDQQGGVGNVLSAAQSVAFTISPGLTENVPLTLSGLPKAIQVLPISSNTVQSIGGVMDLFGQGTTHKLLVQALDADGNVIFGQGAPTFTVAQATPLPALVVAVGTPSPTTPNVFTVSPPATFAAGTATLNITASYTGQATNGCALTGAVCTGTQLVDMQELLAVVNGGGSNKITIYETGNQKPYATVTAGVSNPTALTFDGSGNLYVANCLIACNVGTSTDNVTIYAPPYTGAPSVITNGIFDPKSLAVNSAGELFVGNCASCSLGGFDSVTRYKPPFSAASHPVVTVTNNVVDPVALAFDSNGNLWVADCGSCDPNPQGDAITSYSAPNYTGSAVNLLGFLNAPVSMAFDSANDLMVANANAGNVKIFYPPTYASSGLGGPNTIGQVNSTFLSQPLWVLSDANKNLWIADRSDNADFRCAAPFTGNTCATNATYPNLQITSGVTTPLSIALDGQGNFYSANSGASTITEYAPSSYTTLEATMTNNGLTPFAMAVLP